MFVVSLSHFVSVSEPSVSASCFSLVIFLFLSDNVFVCKVILWLDGWLLQSACQMFLGKMRNSKQLSNASIRICMSVNVGQKALEWVKEGCCINR